MDPQKRLWLQPFWFDLLLAHLYLLADCCSTLHLYWRLSWQSTGCAPCVRDAIATPLARLIVKLKPMYKHRYEKQQGMDVWAYQSACCRPPSPAIPLAACGKTFCIPKAGATCESWLCCLKSNGPPAAAVPTARQLTPLKQWQPAAPAALLPWRPAVTCRLTASSGNPLQQPAHRQHMNRWRPSAVIFRCISVCRPTACAWMNAPLPHYRKQVMMMLCKYGSADAWLSEPLAP